MESAPGVLNIYNLFPLLELTLPPPYRYGSLLKYTRIAEHKCSSVK